MIKNFLAFIGLLALLLCGAAAYKISVVKAEFDPQAIGIYKQFAHTLITRKDAADAMVWVTPVEDGIGFNEVIDSMKSLATGNNLLFVGESPFYKQAEAVTGQPYRHISFLNFCDVRVGMKMADYNNAYTAIMPCTISVVENPDGKIFIYTMNMDFLIHGGKPLPADLRDAATDVRDRMIRIIEGAAKGEF